MGDAAPSRARMVTASRAWMALLGTLVIGISPAQGAAGPWQTDALVEFEAGASPGSDPVACGYRYRHSAGVDLIVEKRVVDGRGITAVQTRGAALMDLRTASFDSTRDLVASVSSDRREADLEQSDVGGMLFVELAISGGELRVQQAGVERRLTLPAPLSRDITALYLNCAGDLFRQE